MHSTWRKLNANQSVGIGPWQRGEFGGSAPQIFSVHPQMIQT